MIFFVANPKGIEQIRKASMNMDNQSGVQILVMAFGALMFIIMSNSGAASTAISREGQNLFVCKYIPMSYKKQIMAKALSGIILTSINVVLFVILGALVAKLPISILIAITILGFLGVLTTAFIGIFIDLNFPKLQWDNEQKAVKQNMNLMLNMLITAVLAGLTIFLVIMLSMDLWLSFGLMALIYGVIAAVMYYVVSTLGAKVFNSIE